MSAGSITLGLRANWRQFSLLVLINAFVGAMIGLERTIVPLIAEADFGLASRSIMLSFLVSFGIVKATANLFAGRMSDRLGRKPILVAGWLAGLPAPFLIIFAPNWSWVVAANVLLGINQGFCWSTTVIMKIDLAGPNRRGLAMGLNEFAGYLAVSLMALLTGYLAAAYGLREAPFYPGIVIALMGLLLSGLLARETRPYARLEAQAMTRPDSSAPNAQNESIKPSFAQILLITSWKDRALFAVSQAGMVNNLNDGMIWGLAPIFLAGKGLLLEEIGMVAAMYPGVWGISQLLTGALSDRLGRKWMIVSGMWIQALGIGLFVAGTSLLPWLSGSALLGFGTALVYPTLLAAVSDVAHPEWRASAVGVYRLWRDGGYAVGALLSGILADALSIPYAMLTIATLTFISGTLVAAVMYETLPSRRKNLPVALPDQREESRFNAPNNP
ncbi:MAG: MFS transporter [Chloroflexi bacterium RBG_16_57_11]|nr:MAG: MFS transporter [Chloroflexi bacterium RBG_16_57_11]